jgi:hypothetical protein
MANLRKAQCSCGSVTATTPEEPIRVVACHCLECQRRTGSPFGVSAWFKSEDVETKGETTSYQRISPANRAVHFNFCPKCATTLFYTADLRPGLTALPIGTFDDPHFPAPVRSLWEKSRHDWIDFKHDLEQLDEGTTS